MCGNRGQRTHRASAAPIGVPLGGVLGASVVVADPLLGGTPRRVPQDSAEALYRSATDAFSRGDYRRAARLFEQVTTRYPRSAQRAR